MAGLLLASVLSWVFLLSAGYKISHWPSLAASLNGYSLLSFLPRWAASPVAVAVALAELAIGMSLQVPATRLAGAASAVILALGFVSISAGDKRAEVAECGCWAGGPLQRASLLARSGVILMLALGLAVLVIVRPDENVTGWLRLTALMTLPFALLILELPTILDVFRITPDLQGGM